MAVGRGVPAKGPRSGRSATFYQQSGIHPGIYIFVSGRRQTDLFMVRRSSPSSTVEGGQHICQETRAIEKGDIWC